MRVLFCLVLAFYVTGGMMVASAQDTPDERETLKGLKGVRVVVEDLKPEVEQAGLTKASIQTDVELKLRLAGIPILTDSDAPFLLVDPQILRGSSGIWSFCIKVELGQKVFLSRAPAIGLLASTWSVGSFGHVSEDTVRTLRDPIKDKVDQFINAYSSVNPR